MPATKKKPTTRKTAAKKTAVKKAAKKSTRGRKPKGFTRETFHQILEMIRQGEKTLVAISQSGFSSSKFYQWIKDQDVAADSQEFMEALKRAQLERDQILNQGKLEEGEAELKRRAVDGWDEPVFNQGELVGTKRKYSDTCLVFMLKALAPEKYRESAQVEIHNQVHGGPLPTAAERKKLEADLTDMVRGLQQAAARESAVNIPTEPDQDD